MKLYFNVQRTDFKESQVKLFGYNIFYSYTRKDFGWFRIFGIGLSWKDANGDLLFAERMGFGCTKIGGYIFKFLPWN